MAPFLLHNKTLILFRNPSHLYFQMGSCHSSGENYLSRGSMQPKLVQSDKQESYFLYPADNYCLSPCFSGWINKGIFSPCIGNLAIIWEISLMIRPTLVKAKWRKWWSHCAHRITLYLDSTYLCVSGHKKWWQETVLKYSGFRDRISIYV